MSRYDPVLSMFHRRLLMLFGGVTLVMLLLVLQAGRLAVAEGGVLREQAEARLNRRTFLPTRRGDIRDRNGKRLAVDRASYSVAVRYDLINGTWAGDQARKLARRGAGRRWAQMTPEKQNQQIEARFRSLMTETVDPIWTVIEVNGGLGSGELDARRAAIVEDVGKMVTFVQGGQRRAWEAHNRQRAEKQFGRVDREGPQFQPQPIREQLATHVILPRISNDVAYIFQRLALGSEGLVEVIDDTTRTYPWDVVDVPVHRAGLPGSLRSDEPAIVRVEGVADHILGRVRTEAWAADIERRPFVTKEGTIDHGGYRPGDRVGATGLETVFERALRGERGQFTMQLDTRAETRRAPVPGEALDITIDVALQSRVQALLSHDVGLTVVQPWHHNDPALDGRALNSAAVVLEIETGEILAMVSMPTMAMGRKMDARTRAIAMPAINRPVEGVYPPGSILKPLVLASAVMAGTHDLDRGITCNGHYFPDNDKSTRCWIYRPVYEFATHGELRASEALGRSCNIYFYTLADGLGLMGMTKWLGRFGLGQRLDVGLMRKHTALVRKNGEVVKNEDNTNKEETFWTGESAGTLPTTAHKEKAEEEKYIKSLRVIVGIGQGPITWSPVQAANAYAQLARGGSVRDATLIRGDTRERSQREDLDIPSPVRRAALEGLRASIEERWGTGYRIKISDDVSHPIINVQGVTCYMKTGTAQAPALRLEDTNGDGTLDSKDKGIEHLDHAWVVGLVGPKGHDPKYAIAVLVEYGGSGGRAAGPIANEVIRALQFEGYLPGAPEADEGDEA